MNLIYIPEDTYTIESGSYAIRRWSKFTYINYEPETASCETFLNRLVESLEFLNNDYTIYMNQNYLSYTYYGYKEHYCVIEDESSSDYIVNNWMYPKEITYLFKCNNYYPVTRTISIIINSNTLPIHTVTKSFSVNIYNYGTNEVQSINIPSGNYTSQTFFTTLLGNINGWSQQYFNFLNIPYFPFKRNTIGFLIYDNEELFKYYGSLHMMYTFPADTVFSKAHIMQFTDPLYRSLHIPEGKYTLRYLLNYINNNSEYVYTFVRNNYQSKPCYQFNAKVVDNDIVIYTTDGSEFIINPICHLNTYQESEFASEHRLCPVPEDCIKYESIIIYPYQPQEIHMVPVINGSYSNFSVEGLPKGFTFNTETGEINGHTSNIEFGVTYVKITCPMFIGDIVLSFNLRYKYRSVLQSNMHDQVNLNLILSILQEKY